MHAASSGATCLALVPAASSQKLPGEELPSKSRASNDFSKGFCNRKLLSFEFSRGFGCQETGGCSAQGLTLEPDNISSAAVPPAPRKKAKQTNVKSADCSGGSMESLEHPIRKLSMELGRAEKADPQKKCLKKSAAKKPKKSVRPSKTQRPRKAKKKQNRRGNGKKSSRSAYHKAKKAARKAGFDEGTCKKMARESSMPRNAFRSRCTEAAAWRRIGLVRAKRVKNENNASFHSRLPEKRQEGQSTGTVRCSLAL